MSTATTAVLISIPQSVPMTISLVSYYPCNSLYFHTKLINITTDKEKNKKKFKKLIHKPQTTKPVIKKTGKKKVF